MMCVHGHNAPRTMTNEAIRRHFSFVSSIFESLIENREIYIIKYEAHSAIYEANEHTSYVVRTQMQISFLQFISFYYIFVHR